MVEETAACATHKLNCTISLPGTIEKQSGVQNAAFTPASRFWQLFKKRMITNFTPGYFASVMGTGISAVLLYDFPFSADWLRVCGLVMGVVCATFFVILCCIFVMALVFRRDLCFKIHTDSKLGPYTGCFVMGYTTLVSFMHSVFGKSVIMSIWVLWWVVVFGSVYTSFVTLFFSTMGKHRRSPNRIEQSALSLDFLLPVVTLSLASSVGGLITIDLPNTNLQIITMLVSFVMWSVATVQASIILTINYWRIFVYKIPSSGQVFTMFFPIGFVGQSAYSIFIFGQNCATLLLKHHNTVSDSAYVSFLGSTARENDVSLAHLPLILSSAFLVTTVVLGFILMAFGYFLTFCAFVALFSKMAPFAVKRNEAYCYQTTSHNFFKRSFVGCLKFQRGFWSMTFPLGTMSLANTHMYTLHHGMKTFHYVGVMYAVICISVAVGSSLAVLYKFFQMISDSFYPREDCCCPV